MALVVADRVKETTTTTGTGTYTLAGAVTGFESFSAIGNANTTYYCCTDGTDFEVGIGTYTASGTTLARTTILQSSNSDAAVNWTSGTRDIFCTQPAEKAVFFDADGTINIPDGSSSTNNLTFGASEDLRIYHDGGASRIVDFGTGPLALQSQNLRVLNAASSELMASFVENGAVELYHDNAKRFETLSTGGLVQRNSGAASLEIRNTNNNTGTSRLTFSTHDGSTYNQFRYSWDDDEFQWWKASSNIMSLAAGQLTLTSTDAAAGTEPVLTLYRNSATPADSDDLGQVMFKGRNDASQDVNYASIFAEALDVSDGTEDGQVKIQVMDGGSLTSHMRIGNDFTVFDSNPIITAGKTLFFEGSTADSLETQLTVKDPTADRIIYLPDADGTVRVVQRKNITSNLAVGWRTIAVLEGRDSRSLSNQRLIAKFTVADIDTSRHNMFSFRAQHSFGQDNALQVENYSTFGTDSITAVRIKASTSGNGIYAGAVIQIYVADANNAITVYLDENDLENGQDDLGRVILKDGIADATDPGNVGYSTAGYSSLIEQVQIDLQRIEPGGIATTGDFYTYSDIKFEGSTTNNANETTLTVTSPTADRTITLPDATGTVVLQDSSGHIYLGDNEEIHLGDGSDFKLVHDGTNNIIRGNANPTYIQTDDTIFLTKNAASETMAKFIGDGAVELYYDNVKRFETQGNGFALHTTDVAIEVTDQNGFGVLEIGGSAGALMDLKRPKTDDFDMRISVTGSDGGTGNVQSDDLHLISKTGAENYLDATVNGAVNLYYDNVSKLSTTSDGVQITDTGAGSTARLELGTYGTTEKGELRLHGSTANKYSTIYTTNGNLHIDSAGTTNGIYLNWYTSDGGSSHTGVYFGTGNSGQAAVIDNAGNFTLNGNIDVSDTKEVRFGNDDDLKIYHDGSNSYIDEAGTGNLYIRAGGTNNISLTDSTTYLYHNGNSRLQTTTDGVDIINSDSGSAIGPKLHLYRNSSSPADFDDMGGLVFTGNNSAGDRHEYSSIIGEVADVTDGSEDAYIRYFTNVGGSNLEHMVHAFGSTTITGQLKLNANTIHSNPHILFEGSTADNFETSLYVADPTADRTITLPDITGEVVVGASLFPSGTTNDGLPTAKALNLANPPENDDHVFHPYLNNDLGHFIDRGGSYAWGGLSSNPSENSTKNLFNANADTVNIQNSSISGSTYTLTLTNLPKVQTYSSYIGIVFGHDTFAPGSIVIETSTDGGSNWTTRLNDSDSKTVYACTYDTGGTGTNAIRFTFTAAPGSSMVRIQSIAAYNYNSAGMENYFLPLSGGTVYGNTTINGTLSATTKSFDIPHPTQDGMRLRYGSLEGPENGVYVRGRLTGSSVIELPEHWAGLVDEDSITVQLTAIGKSQDLWVEEVSIEQVKVCDASTDCFYMVMAERKDVDKLEVEYAAEV